MELKLVFAVIATVISTASFYPYFRDIFRGMTKPHLYTWLIWTVTTGTATAAIWRGGGGVAVVSPAISVVLTFFVFLLCFRYGTKNITVSDTLILVGALASVFIWWQLKNPLLALIVATGTDLLGYVPTIRKSWFEPWSESILSWVTWIVSIAFSILALEAYNPLTLTFLVPITAANLFLVGICLARRPAVPKPQ
jgi:hypothetical protein